MATGSDSVGDGPGRVESHRSRDYAARDAVQHHPGGSLWAAAAAARESAAARTGVSESGFPALVLGHHAAGRRLPAYVFGGSGALAGWGMVGAGGSHASAIGCGLRA